MNRGLLGVRELNARLQELLNPQRPGESTVDTVRVSVSARRDKVIQLENNYDKEVFNGDIGFIERIDPIQHELTSTSKAGRSITISMKLDQLGLAYAITIHKSQGSEFPAVVIPDRDGAVHPAPAEPDLYRHHSRPAHGRRGRPEKGARRWPCETAG